MKLVGELKNKVEKTETLEDAKDLIKNAGMELTDGELDQVAGGRTLSMTNMAFGSYKTFGSITTMEDTGD